MKVTINRLTKIYKQFADSRIAYFDLSRYNKKFHKPVLWILNKLGLKEITAEEYLPSDVIELDDVIEQIYANKAVLENVLHREAKYLFVGHDVMKRIGMRYVYGAVQLPIKIQSSNPFLANNIAGLKLIFVPYMQGMLVTSDLESLVAKHSQATIMSDVPSIMDLPSL